ncbi:unnamed protein product [Discosporangium mesarthrocarpum]
MWRIIWLISMVVAPTYISAFVPMLHGRPCNAAKLGFKMTNQSPNAKGLMMAAGNQDGVKITFKPSNVQTTGAVGETLLDVARSCNGMIEDSQNPFCRDGGCYNCEVEVADAEHLGLADNLVRACLFKVPPGVEEVTLLQMNSDEAFEDML